MKTDKFTAVLKKEYSENKRTKIFYNLDSPIQYIYFIKSNKSIVP